MNRLQYLTALLNDLYIKDIVEKQLIHDIKRLLDTLELYYKDLDSLAKRLQDNMYNDKVLLTDITYEQDTVALCSVLDAIDGAFDLYDALLED